MQSAATILAAGGGSNSNGSSEGRIIKEHERRIRYMALPFVGRGVSLDDLMQEGSIGLLEAARNWDPSKGAQLWTYARRFVLGGIFRFVTREIHEPSRDLQLAELDEEESIDVFERRKRGDFVDAQLSDIPSPEDVAELGEDLTILEQEIDALNDEERDVLWKCFGEDQTLRDVERTGGLSHGGVQRIYHGAIAKLRERMEARS